MYTYLSLTPPFSLLPLHSSSLTVSSPGAASAPAGPAGAMPVSAGGGWLEWGQGMACGSDCQYWPSREAGLSNKERGRKTVCTCTYTQLYVYNYTTVHTEYSSTVNTCKALYV